MKIRHIIIFLTLVATLIGCGRRARIIPKKDLAKIYADMYVADQWLLANSEYRSQADTSLFYEPIFENYGYTTEDYQKSVNHYMQDAKRFSDILSKSAEIIDAQLSEVQKERTRKRKEEEKELERMKAEKEKALDSTRFDMQKSFIMSYFDFKELADTSRNYVLDSLHYEIPSLRLHFPIDSVTQCFTKDTTKQLFPVDSTFVQSDRIIQEGIHLERRELKNNEVK